jgi:hypothetical protein
MRRSDDVKWIAGVAVTVTLLAGCAMSGARARVREIHADGVSRCKFLGIVEGAERTGWSMSDDQLGAMNDIRRRVSAMGGNAFLLTHGTVDMVRAVVRADAYRCP